MRLTPAAVLLIALAVPVSGQGRMTPELLWKLGCVSGGEVSPDGKLVAYSVRRTSLEENKGFTDLWVVPIEGPPSAARKLAEGPPNLSDAHWAKLPAGARIVGVAKKGETAQAWAIDPADGSWTAITDVAGGLEHAKVAPGGGHVAFTRRVKLDATVQDLHPDLPKADARIIDGLMYRHWDSWHDFSYSHLHVAPIGGDGRAGAATDLMENLRADCPDAPFGGAERFAWSPDGRFIAWDMKHVATPATSTDTDVYVREIGAEGGARCVSAGLDGYDQEAAWSPDGRRLAWLSMERPGFEADRNRILVWDRSDDRILEATAGQDRSAHDLRWAPSGSALWFRSEERGTEQVLRIDLGPDGASAPVPVTAGRFNWSLAGVSPDGATLVLARQDMLRPPELLALPAGGGPPRPLTAVNDAVYAGLELPQVTERWTPSTDGRSVHAWVVLPPGFDPKARHPMLTYCQGGPQSQIGQAFSFRWNFHLMAAKGYVVLATNRRGLPGFGQEWNDAISGDWGGQAMRDVLAATDSLMTEPWIDARRAAAVGASYGGYSVYWLMGHAEDRFRCMIAHCGVFNLESMYGSTEELWFPDWDLGGPYWQGDGARAAYDANSPHRFAGRWKTPLLVIHGEKDFRVPVTQGMEAYTAAQVQGVPSRFLYFPGEGHWIMTPQNSVLWQRVFFQWLDRWLTAEK